MFEMLTARIRFVAVRLCLVPLVASVLMTVGCNAPQPHAEPKPANDAEKEFVQVHEEYVAKFKPMFIEASEAWWVANTTGSDAAFARKTELDGRLMELQSDKARFEKLKNLKEGGGVTDPIPARELDVMYRAHLGNQADKDLQKRIIAIQNECEQIFNTHRGRVDGIEQSENDIRKTLSETKDSEAARKAWMAYMDVGPKVEAKLKEVVRLRNQQAQQLGFADFFAMQLYLQEIDQKELFKLFDDLDNLTRAPSAKLKAEIDDAMSKRFGIAPDKLRPWHYGDLFFQEAPKLGDVDLDSVWKDQDIVAITKDYYQSMDMPADDIIARSDLYEKKGKSPHAFETNINRDQDIRVLANITDNAYWADTVVHEVGHGVYDKYIRSDVPFLLHDAANPLTTEGIAMMFGGMTKNEDFLIRVRKLDREQAAQVVAAAKKANRAQRLIFSRWAQVVVRFEQGMYANPDQDLSKLWWDLKKRYQMLNPPDQLGRPDYAAKVHIVTSPVYYHSYLMGDLFACQVYAFAAKKYLNLDDPNQTCFYGRKDVGKYFKDEIFGPGELYHWNQLTRRATGEELSPKAFAKQCE